jgi:hypothetical protein
MREAAHRLVSSVPERAVKLLFLVFLVLATVPAWRVFAFGLTLNDLLNFRCFPTVLGEVDR